MTTSGNSEKMGTVFNHVFEELSGGSLVADSAIKLEIGAPDKPELEACIDILSKATQHRLQSENGYLFQYGCRQGDCKFRWQMSKVLTEGYKDEVDSEDLMVTCGASHGLYMVASMFFNRGDIVFLEDPSYFIALELFKKDLGMKTVPVPYDETGINMEKLDTLLKEHQKTSTHEVTERQPYWSLMYLIPTFNNPKGSCLSEEKCEQIVKLARKYNILVICDDVYNLLSYAVAPGERSHDEFLPPPKRLFAYDKKTDPDYKGHVISNGSFSKLLGPGMRLGWMEAPSILMKIIRSSGVVMSGGGWNNYTSGIIASALELGLISKHIEAIRQKYKNNLDAVYQTMQDEMPAGVVVSKPEGGFFIWVEFPEKVDSTEVNHFCTKEYGVSFAPGIRFSATGSFKNCARICFTYHGQDVLVNAVKKVCQAAKKYC